MPVIDILAGAVVRGVGGRRSEYRPVVSSLSPTAEPLVIADAFRTKLGLHQLYIADLDGILHARPNLQILRQLAQDRFAMWVDAGIRCRHDAEQLCALGITTVVAGLETLKNVNELQSMVAQFGSERICFSLDLKQGRPLGGSEWPSEVKRIVELAVSAGVANMVVLDLADVGEGNGVSTIETCCWIRSAFPNLFLAAGGGVRDRSDLLRLKVAGASAALVSSALHDGRLTASDIADD